MGNPLSLAQDTRAVILQTLQSILSIDKILVLYTHKIHWKPWSNIIKQIIFLELSGRLYCNEKV